MFVRLRVECGSQADLGQTASNIVILMEILGLYLLRTSEGRGLGAFYVPV